MKQTFSVVFLLILLMTAVEYSSASTHRLNKRYYDGWNSNGDLSSSANEQNFRIYPHHQKGYKKEDPCANKPLWYLKYQARLGRLSPFYECLSVHGI